MTYLTLRRPTQNFFRFYNRPTVFQNVFSKPRGYNWRPSTDISETDDSIDVRMELPGVSKDDVNISVMENKLTIKGEKRKSVVDDSKDFQRNEREFGSFERTFTLPSLVPAEDITADIRDGVLSLSIPKPEESRPKEIQIENDAQ